MAIIDAKDPPARRPSQALSARLQAWLAGDHGVARRMAGTAFVIRVASSGVVFLSQILLARWMGSFEFGIYVYVWTWLLLLGDLVHLGLPLAAQRHIPEYIHRNQLDLLRGYLIGSRWLTFGLGTAAAILGAAIVHACAGSLDRNMVVPFYLACVALPFYALSLMLDGVARAYNWIAIGCWRLRSRSGSRRSASSWCLTASSVDRSRPASEPTMSNTGSRSRCR